MAVRPALKPKIIRARSEILERNASNPRCNDRSVGGHQGNRDLRADVVRDSETSRGFVLRGNEETEEGLSDHMDAVEHLSRPGEAAETGYGNGHAGDKPVDIGNVERGRRRDPVPRLRQIR